VIKVSSVLFFAVLVVSLNASAQKKKDYTSYVDPFIGTQGLGNTYPGAVMPYGMLQTGPVTDKKKDALPPYYHYKDSTIYGFICERLDGILSWDNCHVGIRFKVFEKKRNSIAWLLFNKAG
jgi:putative alpha-1,2-mannosidase